MKKIKLFLSAVLTLGILCSGISCNHEHDSTCGYDFTTGKGCTHECVYDDIELLFESGKGPSN